MNSNSTNVFVITLLALMFFGLMIMPLELTRLVMTLAVIFFIVINRRAFRLGLFRSIAIFSLLIFISCLVSHYVNGQPLISVISRSYEYYMLLFFIVPFSYSLSVSDSLNTIYKISVIYCVAYMLQWAIYPTILFWGASVFDDVQSLSQYRVRISGTICSYYLLFYSLHQLTKKFSAKYIITMLLGIFPIVMMGFRTTVLLSVICAFLIVFQSSKNIFKLLRYGLALVVVLSVLMTYVPFVTSKVNDMIERQEEGQSYTNDNYIRVLALNYYQSEFAKMPNMCLTGGGVYVESSRNRYSNIYDYGNDHGFFVSDLGLYGLSLYIGVPAVLLLILITLWGIIRAKEDPLIPIRYTFLLELLSSITTSEIYRSGNLVILGFMLYVVWKSQQIDNPKLSYEKNRYIDIPSCS